MISNTSRYPFFLISTAPPKNLFLGSFISRVEVITALITQTSITLMNSQFEASHSKKFEKNLPRAPLLESRGSGAPRTTAGETSISASTSPTLVLVDVVSFWRILSFSSTRWGWKKGGAGPAPIQVCECWTLSWSPGYPSSIALGGMCLSRFWSWSNPQVFFFIAFISVYEGGGSWVNCHERLLIPCDAIIHWVKSFQMIERNGSNWPCFIVSNFP